MNPGPHKGVVIMGRHFREPPRLDRTSQAVAQALADGFLAGVWTHAALKEAGADVLGWPYRWLGPIATSVLAAYRDAPRDRPRELAAFLSELPRLRVEAYTAKMRRRPLRIHKRLVRPTRTVAVRWDTPAIDDLAALASYLGVTDDHLDWYADRREINRHSTVEPLRHYRYTWLAGRLIEAPKPRLRALQRRLLADLLGRLPVHDQVHGFVPGRGPHTFAAVHAGHETVIRIDLTSFFTSVTASRVYGLWRTAGYPEPVAHALAAICTTRTPMTVLRAAPTTLTHRAYRLAMLRSAHLPQGAPTSPALANLCAFRLDRRLQGLAVSFDVTYARYADDLAFSGRLSPARSRALISQVDTIAADEGFRVHPAKLRVRGQGDRQLLAGLVVNEHPAVPREEYDRSSRGAEPASP
jgi:RNA-directed DNA polymerase